jgi:hypothetical protein
MARPPAGPPGPSDSLAALARQWVEQSCLDQGLPAKITERSIVVQVAELLGVPSASERRTAPAAEAPKEQRAA